MESFPSFVSWKKSARGRSSCGEELRQKKRQRGGRKWIRNPAESQQPTDTCDKAAIHAVSQHLVSRRASPHASEEREMDVAEPSRSQTVPVCRGWMKNSRAQEWQRQDFIEHDNMKSSSHWTVVKTRYFRANAFAYISIRPFFVCKERWLMSKVNVANSPHLLIIHSEEVEAHCVC